MLVVFLGVIGLVFGGQGRRRPKGGKHAAQRPARSRFQEEQPAPKVPAIVVNPTKLEDLDAVRAQLRRAALRLGWDEPLFIETTEDDPGYGQTREALRRKVDVVCALGGDGTVRVVGQVLSGTDTPMGLLPAGTGNLLARNLTVPTRDLDHALEVALTGRNRRLDVGWVVLDPTDEQLGDLATAAVESENGTHHRPWHRPHLPHRPQRPQRPQPHEEATDPLPADEVPHSGVDPSDPHPPDNVHAFLVMAGIGLDADVMDDTSEELKAKVGWAAYVTSGMRQLTGKRFKSHIAVDGTPPVESRARSVLVGNCGELTGGLALMPEAQPDDGILDVVAVTPKGIGGWASVAAHVIRKKDKEHRRLERWRCRNVLVSVEEPQKVEVDGDVLPEASRFLAELRPQSLIVRVGTANPDAREEIGPDRLSAPADEAEGMPVAPVDPVGSGGSAAPARLVAPDALDDADPSEASQASDQPDQPDQPVEPVAGSDSDPKASPGPEPGTGDADGEQPRP